MADRHLGDRAQELLSVDDMEQILTMGMEEGMAAAIGQIDALLAS